LKAYYPQDSLQQYFNVKQASADNDTISLAAFKLALTNNSSGIVS